MPKRRPFASSAPLFLMDVIKWHGRFPGEAPPSVPVAAHEKIAGETLPVVKPRIGRHHEDFRRRSVGRAVPVNAEIPPWDAARHVDVRREIDSFSDTCGDKAIERIAEACPSPARLHSKEDSLRCCKDLSRRIAPRHLAAARIPHVRCAKQANRICRRGRREVRGKKSRARFPAQCRAGNLCAPIRLLPRPFHMGGRISLRPQGALRLRQAQRRGISKTSCATS